MTFTHPKNDDPSPLVLAFKPPGFLGSVNILRVELDGTVTLTPLERAVTRQCSIMDQKDEEDPMPMKMLRVTMILASEVAKLQERVDRLERRAEEERRRKS